MAGRLLPIDLLEANRIAASMLHAVVAL